MERLLEPPMIRRGVIALATIWALTLTTVYTIWLRDGCQPFMPFISDTHVYPGSDFAFTLGFVSAGALMLLSVWQVGTYRELWLEASGVEPKWVSINRLGKYSGMVGGICVVWIADTPWDEELILHIAQAFFIFGGGIMFVICQTLVTGPMSRIEPRLERLKTPRLALLILIVASLCLMLLNFVRMSAVASDLTVMDTHFAEVELCTTLTYQALSEAAFFEWTMTAGLGLSILTILPEFNILTESLTPNGIEAVESESEE